ncbi:IclR family transcriptional regulator [Arthrobacter globiformis]|uniref:IclR family transcriptional regulator n=1 Tax=Arthrobacter globiformis TaxID=1665 RepID=UPI00397846D7
MLVSPMVPSVATLPVSEALSSVHKAAALLIAFNHTGGCATLTELAREACLPKSTAHRLLGILREVGLVDRNDMEWYLRRPVLQLGALALRGGAGALREVALPYMTQLYEETHENVHLAMLEGCEVVYLEKVYGHRSAPSPSRVGHRVGAHVSAVGKAMLAFSDEGTIRDVIMSGLRPATPHSVISPRALLRQLEAVRSSGVAYDLEECRQGLTCVAAPVVTAEGRPVAAISVAGSTRTMRLDLVAEKVKAAAGKISVQAGPDVNLLATAV